jgi:hypothetical protein
LSDCESEKREERHGLGKGKQERKDQHLVLGKRSLKNKKLREN